MSFPATQNIVSGSSGAKIIFWTSRQNSAGHQPGSPQPRVVEALPLSPRYWRGHAHRAESSSSKTETKHYGVQLDDARRSADSRQPEPFRTTQYAAEPLISPAARPTAL